MFNRYFSRPYQLIILNSPREFFFYRTEYIEIIFIFYVYIR